MMTTLLYLQWVERKVIAHIQVRPGRIAWARTVFFSRSPM